MTAFNSGDEPEHRPVRLDTLLDDALSLIQSVLPTNLVLQKDIGQDIASILGDPTQINQVILNLCLNAKDAMAESGGMLRVSLYQTHLGID